MTRNSKLQKTIKNITQNRNFRNRMLNITLMLNFAIFDVNSKSNRYKLRIQCTMADNRARCGHECITNRIIMLRTLIRHDLLHTYAISYNINYLIAE